MLLTVYCIIINLLYKGADDVMLLYF